jgi:hypothetical protein
MNGIVALIKILSLPFAAGAMSFGITYLFRSQQWDTSSRPWIPSVGEVERTFTEYQIGISLAMTILIGLPVLRYLVRRNQIDLRRWRFTWLAVYLPVVLFMVGNQNNLTSVWLRVVILAISVVSASTLWWWMFYASQDDDTDADETAEDAESAQEA